MSKMKIDPAKMMDKMDNICKNMMNMMDKMDDMYKNMMILDNMNNMYKNMTMLMDNMNNMYNNMTMMMNNINNTYNNMMMRNNIGMKMMGNNIGMNMGLENNIGMNMGMENNISNFGNNDWMKGFQMVMNVGNQSQEKPAPKMNVRFKSFYNDVNLVLKYGTTVREALKLYLERVGRPDLIDTEGKIDFICNADRLEFTDNRKIENVFGIEGNIIVHKTKDLLGK